MLALGHEGEMIAEMPYADLQCMLDDPPGYRNYWSAEYLGGLPDEAVDAFCARAAGMIVPSPSQHVLFPGGGAVARETADWPVPWRHAPWCVHPFGLWTDPADDERGRAVGRRTSAPTCSPGPPATSTSTSSATRARTGWSPASARENYDRLARGQGGYDPDNVFHLNHNIRPA